MTHKFDFKKISISIGGDYYQVLFHDGLDTEDEPYFMIRGESHFEKQEIEYQINKISKEINSCKRRLKAFEREKETLIEKLAHLVNDKINGQQKQ